MATTASTTKNYIDPNTALHDTLRRHLKRMLPVKLTRDEQTDIAIAASKKRLAVKQLEADLDAEKKRRQAQINELQREVDVADRELATGEQERPVMCNEIFRDGMVHVVRTDSWEAFESRPATAQEAQRFLPAVESTMQPDRNAPLLDQAAAAQAGAPANDEAPLDGEDDGVPPELQGDEDDDGLGEAGAEDEPGDEPGDETGDDAPADETPAQRSARETEQARAARRGESSGAGKAKDSAKAGGKGKRGRGKGGGK